MWPSPQKTADLVTFTGEIFNAKLYFFCAVNILKLFKVLLQVRLISNKIELDMLHENFVYDMLSNNVRLGIEETKKSYGTLL